MLTILTNFPAKCWLTTLLPVALFTLTACDKQSTQEETPEILRPVKSQIVESPANGRTRTYSGILKAGREAKLSFKVGGTIRDITVRVGDVLTPGAPIARLDQTSYELEVEKARASLTQTQAEKRNAESNYQRVRGLYENNNASREDLDSARASAESARAQVRSEQKSLELARLDLGYTQIKASEPCSVAEVSAEVNENVQAGEAIATVTCGEVNEVEVSIPENLIGSLKQGMSAKVHFDAIPGEAFAGSVAEVGVTSVGAAFPVTLTIKEQHSQLRSGLAAEVTFFFANKTEGPLRIYLPPVAVGQDSEGRFIFVLESGDSQGESLVRRRPVKIGELTSLGLEIVNGVNVGERVVTAGVSVIRDGLRVKTD